MVILIFSLVAFLGLPYKDNQGSNPPPLKLFHISRGRCDKVNPIGLFNEPVGCLAWVTRGSLHCKG